MALIDYYTFDDTWILHEYMNTDAPWPGTPHSSKWEISVRISLHSELETVQSPSQSLALVSGVDLGYILHFTSDSKWRKQ